MVLEYESQHLPPKMTQLCSPKYSKIFQHDGLHMLSGHFVPHPTENMEELTVFSLKVLQLRRDQKISVS